MKMNMDRYGGRKFLLTLATYVGNSVMLWFGKLDQLTYRDAFIATVGAFLTANVIEKVKGVAQPTS
jgi:hypothetical protein